MQVHGTVPEVHGFSSPHHRVSQAVIVLLGLFRVSYFVLVFIILHLLRSATLVAIHTAACTHVFTSTCYLIPIQVLLHYYMFDVDNSEIQLESHTCSGVLAARAFHMLLPPLATWHVRNIYLG